MSIITFKSNERKETGQTLSIAAVATQLAIEHNYKILIISTSFREDTLENCFWDDSKAKKQATKGIDVSGIIPQATTGIGSGIEGLLKVFASNKTSPEIVKNYSKIVLRDRLDVLVSPYTIDYKEYSNISSSYVDVIQLASRYYDLVFVDLCNRMPEQDMEDITRISDVVVVNLTQRLANIDEFLELRTTNELYRRKNIMLLIGRYDAYSKYNIKNITRYLRERQGINAIPYNTLFFEACSEGKIIDLFLKMQNIKDVNDRNYLFIKEVSRVGNNIINKIKELQMSNY